jgi:hypothetical protein
VLIVLASCCEVYKSIAPNFSEFGLERNKYESATSARGYESVRATKLIDFACVHAEGKSLFERAKLPSVELRNLAEDAVVPETLGFIVCCPL